MEIIPKVGLGELHFGMTPAEIRAKFPKEETYEEWMGGNLDDSLLFHGLILMFDNHDGYGPLHDSRLTDILIQGRSDIRLWGLDLLEWTRDKFVDYLDQTETPYEWRGSLLVPRYSISASFSNSGNLANFEFSHFDTGEN